MKEYYSYENITEKELEKREKKGWFSKIDKWKAAKNLVSMAASGCATVVVSRYLKANMPVTDGIFDKAVTDIGMYFVTGLVGSMVAEYCDKELDSMKEAMTKKALPKSEETENGQ